MNKFTAFLLGMKEFRLSCTANLDDEGFQSEYDWGREWAHRLTLRRFDS
jgi:hypothetical protein